MKTTFREFADRGYGDELVAVRRGDKRPFWKDWETYQPSDKDIARWDAQDNNVGLRTRVFPAFDIDCEDETLARQIEDTIRAIAGGNALSRLRPHKKNETRILPRRALVYRLSPFAKTFPKAKLSASHPVSGDVLALELLGDGQQIVVSGPHPDGKTFYRTSGERADQLDELDEKLAHDALEVVKQGLVGLGWTVNLSTDNSTVQPGQKAPGTSHLGGVVTDDKLWELVPEIVSFIPNEDAHWDDWVRVGMAIRAAAGDDLARIEEAFHIWDDWSAKSSKYDAQTTYRKWEDDIDPHHKGDVGFGTLVFLGRQGGWLGELGEPRQAASEAFQGEDEDSDPAWDVIRALGGPGVPASKQNTGPGTVGGRDVVVYAGDWHGSSAPVREWIVEDYIPAHEVSSIYSKGGLGKSLLAQQLGTARALGVDWLGFRTKPGKTLIVACEDIEDELHRRQEAINNRLVVSMNQVGKNLAFLPRSGALDNSLMTFDQKTGKGSLTKFWELLRDLVKRDGYDLLVLDTIADVFSGEENKRHQVNMFVKGCLGRLVRETGCAVLLLGHPSKSAQTDGTGFSGSTAWEGSVRSNMYMRPHDVPGSALRVFSKLKSNYSGLGGEETMLEWRRGFLEVHSRVKAGSFVAAAGSVAGAVSPFTGRVQLEDDIDEYVLAGMRQAEGQGVNVRAAPQSPYFLPKWLMRSVVLPGHLSGYVDVNVLTDAVYRLLRRGEIIEKGYSDPTSKKWYKRLEIVK